MAKRQDFCVEAGETFMPTIRWATPEIISFPISAINQAAPVTVTAVGHLVPPGWDVAVVGVKGMTQINSPRYPPDAGDWHPASVVNDDNVQLNDISSADFSAYTSGGFLVYKVPMKLTGISASMKIYDAPPEAGGVLLTTLTDGLGTIVIDAVNKTITPRLETAGLTWTNAYYELMMTDLTAVVIALLEGAITIE